MTGYRSVLSAVGVIAALGLGASGTGAKEITLKGASCFPIGSVVSVGFEQFDSLQLRKLALQCELLEHLIVCYLIKKIHRT